ncbi:MAG: hypothetical protein Ta2D_13720 [Rickettsiales bacterium]|nr:MAG: hypothetical protein Ta2D_13720 [Rickettsiales bacterium]
MSDIDKKKSVIGLYGEMQLSMILHEMGWQVHRAYIDEGIDFTITKYWCPKCKKFSNQFIRKTENTQYKNAKCVTNLCEFCKDTELQIISKYLQVKTSEGNIVEGKDYRTFSFHPKIRYNMNDVYYVWIAVFNENNLITDIKEIENPIIHFYIFKTEDVKLFDNFDIDTYQITDNQKTSLKIDKDGNILDKGIKYSYECLKTFHNNFKVLEKINI